MISLLQLGPNWHKLGTWDLVTMDKKGKKQIAIAGLQDKRQITAVMCGSSVGEVLPPQQLHEGKTIQHHQHYTFPADWLISRKDNHWSSEITILQYIREVIVPFLGGVRHCLTTR